MAQLTLAVIYGSRTCEHDVSVISALQCMDAAEKGGYRVVPVYISQEGLWYTGAPLRRIETYQGGFDAAAKGIQQVLLDVNANSGELLAWPPAKGGLFAARGKEVVAHIDVAMPVLHGLHGEDGTLQGLLELANIPYTSSGVLGSAVGMDKIAMKMLCRGVGLPVVPDVWFLREAWLRDPDAQLDRVEAAFPYPVFVKPANLGSSIGVSRAADRDTLREAIEVAASFDRRILVEAGLNAPIEVNCAVLGYGEAVRASVCEKPATGQEMLSYDDKYLHGGKGMASQQREIPAPIGEEKTAQAQRVSSEAFRALDCKGVVRVDLMIDGQTGALYINEINTIPGSLAFYLWTEEGMGYPALIEHMVECAFRAQAQKQHSVFAYRSTILANYQKAGGTKGTKETKI